MQSTKIRHTKHALVACDSCRVLKLKCSGTQPCERCVLKKRTCVFSSSKFKKNAESSAGSSSNRGEEPLADLLVRDAESSSSNVKRDAKTPAARRNDEGAPSKKKQRSKEQSRPQQLGSASGFAHEVDLADTSSGSFLMQVFISKILPHHYFFLKFPVSKNFLKFFRSPNSLAQQVQRDGALMCAARACGHAFLAKQIAARMKGTSQQLFDNPSKDAFSAFVLYSRFVSTEDLSQTIYLQKVALDLLPSDASDSSSDEEARKSSATAFSFSAICKEEADEHVSLAYQNLVMMTNAAPSVEARNHMNYRLHFLNVASTPCGRSMMIILLAVAIDLKLLGILIPPVMNDIVSRRDPENKFGLRVFMSHGHFVPPPLQMDMARMLLRRLAVALQLIEESASPLFVIGGYKMIIDALGAAIQLHSGNVHEAISAATRALEFASTNELQFMPSEVVQNIFFVSCIFFAVEDKASLARAVAIVRSLQGTNTMADIALAVLSDSLDALVEKEQMKILSLRPAVDGMNFPIAAASLPPIQQVIAGIAAEQNCALSPISLVTSGSGNGIGVSGFMPAPLQASGGALLASVASIISGQGGSSSAAEQPAAAAPLAGIKALLI